MQDQPAYPGLGPWIRAALTRNLALRVISLVAALALYALIHRPGTPAPAAPPPTERCLCPAVPVSAAP